jgi:hypothetical protein
MARRESVLFLFVVMLVLAAALPANAQSFRVQCPTFTITHPDPATTSNTTNNGNPYNGPTQFTTPTTGTAQWAVPTAGTVNGGIKCQQVSGGDGYATMGDGAQTFMFSFGPLSGLADIAAGHPGTEPPNVFNTPFPYCLVGSFSVSAVVLKSAGAGYAANDTVTLTGGTTNAVVTVNTVDTNGAILTYTLTSGGAGYTTLPTGYTTSGAGTGASFVATLTDCSTPLMRGDPATTDGAMSGELPWTPGNPPTDSPLFTWNGAVGLSPDIAQIAALSDLVEGPLTNAPPATAPHCPAPGPLTVTGYLFEPLGIPVGGQVTIKQAPNQPGTTTPIVGATPIPSGYLGTFTVTCVDNGTPTVAFPAVGKVISPTGATQFAFQYQLPSTASTVLGAQTALNGPTASTPAVLDGHVDPRPIIDIGVMNGNIPAPLVAFDEDDEMFLTLTNVGMIMRPDLFEQHTIHFHGYPNASSFYDGVPDASVAINIGASFTYYYLAPDAGTYFWHCHITPPEHLQMGMVGQLHVRPRQDRVPAGTGTFPNGGGGSLYTYLGYQNGIGLPMGVAPDPRTVCNTAADILCSATMPFGGATANTATQGLDKLGNQQRYTYNDGDGSTAYDVEYPIQMHGFDPNFHFVGMTFNPEGFVDMKDKYFLLNGRSYPDTVGPNPTNSALPIAPAGPQASMSSDGQLHYSQPMPAVINIPVGGRALLRLVNLSVSEYHTLQSLGVPMKEVGFNAKLLRDQVGMNTEFFTNSITLGGGESLDVILDASDASCGSNGCATALYPAGSVFYLYTPQLDHLSNDAENFGGLMTEVHICTSVTGPTFGNTCK